MNVAQELLIHLTAVIDLELSYLPSLFGLELLSLLLLSSSKLQLLLAGEGRILAPFRPEGDRGGQAAAGKGSEYANRCQE
ncbi:hypothetical protein [Streptomyces curacoi]|nr:hypothetical protein [Streptomyces curacoi]